MTTIQQRFDELGEQIVGLRSRVFDLTNRLAKIVEHPDTPVLIKRYARGQVGSQPVEAIDGTGWAEAAFEPVRQRVPAAVMYFEDVKTVWATERAENEAWRRRHGFPIIGDGTFSSDGLVTDVMSGHGE